MNTTEACFCKSGHHADASVYAEKPLWEMDGIKVCAIGWTNAEQVWDINDCKSVVLAEAVADYYLLDAVKADMLVQRPFVKKANHSFEVRLHHDTKWRECCDTTEAETHKVWCKPGNRKPSTTQAATYTPPFDEAHVRTIMRGMEMLGEVPATMPVIRARAFLRHARHTAIMAQVFRNYAHYAIAGELRHHAYDNSDVIRNTFGGASGVRAGWFKFVQHVGGAAAAKYAATMFMDGRWNGSYGGEPWAAIANTLYEFESGHWDAWLFVDRMFSLQHNTGSALNKVTWKPGNHTYDANSLHAGNGPLDCHANSKFGRLGAFASEDVRKIVTDYWVLANNDQIARGIEPTPMPEFTLNEAKSTWYEPENGGCNCDLCKPEWYCKACGNELNSKEKGHSEYGGKCEGCAKTNQCEACGKKIVATKAKCDACKNSGAKAKKSGVKLKVVTSTPNVTGYSLTPPSKKAPLNINTAPGTSPAAKLKAIQAAQAAEAANKAANVVDDGEWESDGDVW